MKYMITALLFVFSSACFSGQFQAGFAKIDITPQAKVDTVPTLAAGPQLIEQVYDPIYAKALVLSDGKSQIGFISLDLIYLPPEYFTSLLTELRSKNKLDQVFLSITHTHSGWLPESRLPQLQKQIVNMVATANASLVPVEMGVSTGQLDENYNRIIRTEEGGHEMLWTNPQRQANRPVDTTVGVLHIRQLDGTSLVNMVNYNAHPVITMDLHKALISADYPGQLANTLAQRGAGETLFMLGAAGDINPYDADTNPIELGLKKSNELGTKMADVVTATIKSIARYQREGQFSFETLTLDIPFNPPSGEGEGANMSGEINTLMLNDDIALVSFPGEYFSDFSRQLQQASNIQHTFFLGYHNGSLGYVPTKEALCFGGYGANSKDMNFSVDTGKKHLDQALHSLSKLKESL